MSVREPQVHLEDATPSLGDLSGSQQSAFDYSVEIGHRYAPDRLAQLSSAEEADFYSTALQRHFKDTPEAARLRRIADFFGHSAVRVALVDDIDLRQRQRKSADSWRWQMFHNTSIESVALGAGVDRQRVYKESEFEQSARALVAEIQSMELPEGYRLSQKGDKLKIGSGKELHTIALQGYPGVEDPTFPSCEVLDLAWLKKRLTLAPAAITVLPSTYAGQQERVDTLATLIGIDPEVRTTVLYDEE